VQRRVAATIVLLTIAAAAALTLRSIAGAPRAVIVQEIAAPTRYIAAPAKGVTGSIALPAVPVSTGGAGAIRSAVADPFTLAGIAPQDRARALDCLTAAIYYEAATEGDAGQRAVAQVVLNRVRHPAFPASVCGVVYQGSARAGCQFSFACDGATARAPLAAGWARAARAAARALTGQVFAPVGLATHYHTYAVTPAWNRSLVMTDVVGAHFFHRWKGYWGTAAAFRQRYRGAEPALEPRQVAVAVAVAPVTMPAVIVPARRVGPGAPAAEPVADRLPPGSPVLERWKDSGKPLDVVR
jgi:spore germination cell wall hydrolase CwlJ-like protein